MTIVARSGGMLIPFIIARYFGATNETDSFFLAFSFVFYISNIFAPSLEKLIVPYINEIKEKKISPNHFINKIGLSISVVILILIFILLMLINPIMDLFTNNVQLNNLTFNYIKYIFPLIIIILWSSLFSGVLNAFKMFSVPAISPLFRFICVLFIIILFKDVLGLYSVIIGFIIGELLRLIILMIKMNKSIGYKFSFNKIFDKDTVSFYKVGSFQIYTSLIYGILTILDRLIAARIGEGSITLYHYVERIYFIPYSLFTLGMVPVLLSYWGQEYYNNSSDNKKELISSLYSTLFKITIIICPLIWCMIYFRGALINIFLGNQIGISEYKIVLEKTLYIISLGLLPQILTVVQTNCIIIFKKTNYLFYTAFFVLLVKPILSIALIPRFGLAGLALANTFIHTSILFVYQFYIINFNADKK